MKRKRLVALAMLLALLVSMLNPAAGARASAASVAYVTVMENYIDEEGTHIIGGGFYQVAYGEPYSYMPSSTRYYNGREYDFIDISAPALSRDYNKVYTNSVDFSSAVITVTYMLHTSPATPTPTKAPEKPSVTGSLTPTPAPAKTVWCDVTVKTKGNIVIDESSFQLEVGIIKQIKYNCLEGYNEDGQWCSLDESIALWRQGYYEVTVPDCDFQIVFYVRENKNDGCFIHVTTDFYENEELLKSIPQPVVEYTAAGMEEAGYWYSHNWYETRVYNGKTYSFYKSSASGGDPARPATTGKKAPWMVSSGLKAGYDINIMMAWNRNSGPTPTPTATPTPTLTPTPTATPKPTATPTPKPKIIELDGWKPNVHTDKQVEVEEGKKPRNVTPPIKYDFEFQGYYTEPEGKGTQYYDEDGKCIKEWDEPDMTEKLYADWKAAPPPVYDPYNPTITPEEPETYHVLIKKDGATVQIYADDYDSSTGALNDKQPYFADDLYVNGIKTVEGAMPSTEQVAVRGKTGAWMYDVSLEKVTGTEQTKITVKVPYTLTYQDQSAGGERKEEKGNYSFTFMVDKPYSYWKVTAVDIYKPVSLRVNNAAFQDESIIVPVNWSGVGAPAIPTPVIKNSGSSDAAAGGTYTVETPYTAVYESHDAIDLDSVKEQCRNMATEYQKKVGNVTVKNDKLVIDGVTILDDAPNDTGKGAAPDEDAAKQIQDKIPFTEYTQTYQSGVKLDKTSQNATHASSIRFTYDSVKDATKHQHVSTGDTGVTVNGIKIHTPVVCDGIFSADGTETGRYADEDFGYGASAELTLRGIFNPFTVEVSNYGLHRMLLGYGERDFVDTMSGIDNIDVNENAVKFPFGVYYDQNADSFKADGSVDFSNDRYIPKNTWVKIGNEKAQFYVLGSIEPGTYTVDFRSVAVNCPKDESGAYRYDLTYSANNANINVDKYIARDRISLNVCADFIDFQLNGTNDPKALKDFADGRRMLTLDKGYYFNFYTQTIGKTFNSQTMKVDITPSYTFISADGKIRTAADVYYNENVNGKSEFFVKVGNVKDRSNIHTYTNRDELVGVPVDILRNTVEVSADSQFAGKKRDLFAFGGTISSDYVLRMYPKLNTKLPNKYCSGCYVTYCSQDGRPCSCTDTQKTIFNLSSNEVKSMVQAWYGGLYIPADSFVITKDTKQGMCPMCGKLRYVTDRRTVCPDHKVALTDLAGFDFNNYAANNTVSGNEEFFRKDGYIAVNFQIKAVDGAYERVYTDYDETEIAKQWKKSKVPYRSGDIILYRLDKSIRNAYEIGGSE